MPVQTHPLTPQSLLNPAGSVIRSARLLAENAQDVDVWGLALLAAQAVEMTLKSYLVFAGVSEHDLIRKIGHDLEKCWRKVHELGLSVPGSPPEWCVKLNRGHDSPFLFRYPPTNTGIVLPNLNILVEDIEQLRELVDSTIRNDV